MAEIPSGAPKVTFAVVSIRSGAWPAPASPLASAIEKQPECAAAINSSGLVPLARELARLFQVRVCSGKEPLAGVTVPLPCRRSPSQVALALLSTVIRHSLHQQRSRGTA